MSPHRREQEDVKQLTPVVSRSTEHAFKAGQTIVVLHGEKHEKKKQFNKHKALVVAAPLQGCWLTVKPILRDDEMDAVASLKWRKGG
jgi:hypothetical protein